MALNDKLFLHQEILLLALRDKEGTIAQGAMYQFAIGGAIIAELLLNKRISIDENKKKLVNLIDPSPLHDPLLDECLLKISNAKRRASIQTWISKFANTKNIKHRVAEQLCKLGILLANEDQVLLVFTRKIYPEINPEPERKLIARLHEAIFTDSNNIDPATVVLLSLANNAGILKIVFNKKFSDLVAVCVIEIQCHSPWRSVFFGEIRPIVHKIISLRSEVIVDNIQNDRQFLTVAGIHKSFECVRATVRILDCERTCPVISPVPSARKLCNRHDLDRIYPQVLQVRYPRQHRI